MNARRNEAYKLRVRGWSYNEINKELGIAKSTLAGWFKGLILSETATTRLRNRLLQRTEQNLVRRNKLQTHRARERVALVRREARIYVPELSDEHILVIGTALYWAEGYKRPQVRGGRELTSHSISFLNTDPEMIHIFVQFLVRILRIPPEKIRMRMRLYEHINETEALVYWRKAVALPDIKIEKTTYMVSGATKHKRPYNRLPYGTLQICVYDTDKFHHLMGLIEGVKEKMRYATMPPPLG